MIDHALALTHIDERGAARMVDVSEKPVTLRVAKASGLVIMKPSTLRMISDGAAAKGDVMAAARIAGIAAAKRTGDLIPLCHPLGLDARAPFVATTASGSGTKDDGPGRDGRDPAPEWSTHQTTKRSAHRPQHRAGPAPRPN